jgi:hypothetical protein
MKPSAAPDFSRAVMPHHKFKIGQTVVNEAQLRPAEALSPQH